VEAALGVDALPCDAAPAAVDTMDDLFSVPLVAQSGTTGA